MTENEVRLLKGLKLIAASEVRLPPAGIEAKLLQQAGPVRKRWPLFLAVAATVLLALAIRTKSGNVEPGGRNAVQAAGGPLTPIPYAEPLYSTDRTELVRVNIPVAQLLSWGLSASGSDPNATVNADVLLGEDGLARAVRLVQ